MELIAASRIVRAQARTQKARPYARAIGDMIEMVAGESRQSPLLAEREVHNVGLLVITSDRGLCGAYNSNVLREAQRARERFERAGNSVVVTAVGRRGQSFFRFRRVHLGREYTGVSDQPGYRDARRIAKQLIAGYVSGALDQVVIAYTDFVSTFVQRARVAQILPVPQPEDDVREGPRAVFEYEPEPASLMEALLPRYVEVKIFAALLESAASEHAARRRAMKEATDNAEELLKIYRQQRNRIRQQEITSELSDLVGAAEGLRAR
jgi:F-type H+-transporting ATPase subunit gamma